MVQFPPITFITLIYNNAEFVVKTLESIVAQKYPVFDHVIVDDASRDNSVQVVNEWIRKNSYPARVIVHKQNKGISGSLNEAIRWVTGKYIFMASDDLLLPGKIERDVRYLEANPGLAFVFSKMIIRNLISGAETRPVQKPFSNLFHDYLAGNTQIASPTILYRKSVFDEVGPYDEKILFEDYDMLLRILYKHKAGFIDEYTMIYNIHPKSIQIQREVEIQNTFFKVLAKWKHLPGYRYYVNNRHQYAFCYFATRNKREALKHLAPALTVFWKPRLYNNLFKLLFVWKKP